MPLPLPRCEDEDGHALEGHCFLWKEEEEEKEEEEDNYDFVDDVLAWTRVCVCSMSGCCLRSTSLACLPSLSPCWFFSMPAMYVAALAILSPFASRRTTGTVTGNVDDMTIRCDYEE